MSILQGLLISMIYFLAMSTVIGVGYFTFNKPLVAGFCVGLILGDPATGTMIGAAINILYIGNISAGGTMPSDSTLAAIIGSTLGITAGIDVEAALAIAVPIGLLGTLLWFGRLTVNTFFVQLADRYAQEGKAKKFWLVNVLFPQTLLFLITVIPCFMIVYFGTDYVAGILGFLGKNVLGALMVIGGLLPALGLGLTLKSIFHGEAKVYFFLGFLLIMYFKLDNIALGFIGLIITIMYLQFKKKEEKNETQIIDDEPPVPIAKSSGLITRSDLIRSSIIWGFHAQGAYNYERMQGIGFAHAMTPFFKKFYQEESVEMSQALQRHTGFYNTSNQFAAAVTGLIGAMEEQKYLGAEGMDEEAITAVKTSLMGPLAGIGDTVMQGILTPLLLSFFIGMSRGGNVLGPILYLISMTVIVLGINHFSFMLGYKKGSEAILTLLEGGLINRFIDGAKVMGCIVIGGLVASYVTVKTGIIIPGNTPFNLQEQFFDVILPGAIPLLLTLGCYKLIDKGLSTTKVMLLLIIVGIICSLTTILAV